MIHVEGPKRKDAPRENCTVERNIFSVRGHTEDIVLIKDQGLMVDDDNKLLP